jgi:acyl-coenzyme A thioesterase PaaI-like protein
MVYFPTEKKESWRTRKIRWLFNLAPAYRGTGAWVRFIAQDFKEIQVTIQLNWRTRNLVGVVFGGSIYASIDPMYMIMLMENLGDDYIVWDKSATIRFKRPIKKRVGAHFKIDDALLTQVRAQVAQENEMTLTLPITFEDKQGTVYAQADKELYVAKKAFYKEKIAARKASKK